MIHNSHWLTGNFYYNSFPSGHVGAIVGFCMPLFLGTRWARLPAVVLCLVVAWARLFLQCHHFSDMVVAAIIGMLVGLFTRFRLMPKFFPLDFNSPSPSPRSFGTLPKEHEVAH